MEARVGLGFRPALAAGILAHLDRIDVVEVIADDYFDAPAAARRALRTLATQVPVVLHGVSLGLASTVPAETRRIDAMARLVGELQPAFWSEHLAFVRAGGVEIGHLAAPPRNAATLEGTARNVERARRIVGSTPLLENVASLLDPPGSDRDEACWLRDVTAACHAPLLLDLHNLHANAANFAFDAAAVVDALAPDAIGAIHLAGGRWIRDEDGARRLLDDHLHAVPEAVFALLARVAGRAEGPLTVILERDGRYPPMADLLRELDDARTTLANATRTEAAA